MMLDERVFDSSPGQSSLDSSANDKATVEFTSPPKRIARHSDSWPCPADRKLDFRHSAVHYFPHHRGWASSGCCTAVEGDNGPSYDLVPTNILGFHRYDPRYPDQDLHGPEPDFICRTLLPFPNTTSFGSASSLVPFSWERLLHYMQSAACHSTSTPTVTRSMSDLQWLPCPIPEKPVVIQSDLDGYSDGSEQRPGKTRSWVCDMGSSWSC
ncbi:uncharacterized protein PG998_002910 [Apiospora kogelbergensis]|uniref:uncharacterized protein n=1 Tax=Apiospora kogelbergensis TaxID=1337665 RepID=UPI00312E20FD